MATYLHTPKKAHLIDRKTISISNQIPFHSYGKGDKKWYCVGDIVQWIDQLWPQIDIDWRVVGDDLEAFFQAVLNEGESRKQGVNDAKHHNQLSSEKNIYF